MTITVSGVLAEGVANGFRWKTVAVGVGNSDRVGVGLIVVVAIDTKGKNSKINNKKTVLSLFSFESDRRNEFARIIAVKELELYFSRIWLSG